MPEFNINDLIAEFGAKYENNGQTQRDIRHELMPADDISSEFRMVPWTDTFYRSVYSTIDEVLQAFSIPFVDKGTVDFKPWTQRLGEFKIDKLETPDLLRHSWLAFLTDLKKVDRSKWPFLMWLIRQKLIPRANKDFFLKTSYYGWQVTGYDAAPTVDGATFVRQLAAANAIHPANTSMDGIRTQIAKMDDANRCVKIVMGAWDANDVTFCTQIEDLVEQIPEELRDELDYLWMSKALRKRYRDGKREKYNLYYKQAADLDSIEDHEHISVRGTTSMVGSEQVWSTPKFNRVKPVRADKKQNFDVQKVDRQVKILTDWSYLLTFDVPEYLVTTEHDTSILAADIAAHYS